jgi:hypothetical protein
MKRNIILITLFLFSLFTIFGALTDDNQLYYSFDDDDLSGSNPLDLTPNGNDGINNGSTTGVTGIINEAFSFDGIDDYVHTNNNEYYLRNTYNFWINTTETNERIIGSFDSASKLNQIYFNNGGIDGKILVIYRSSTGNEINSFCIVPNFNDGSWHMITLIYDLNINELHCYFDAVNQTVTNSGSGNPIITNMTHDFYLSARNNAGVPDNFLNADFDEFSIWNRSLSVSEISEIYNSGAGLQYPYG